MIRFAALSCALALACAHGAPVPGITAAQLGVIINDADMQSVAVGEYYQMRRHIPAANIIRLRFRSDNVALTPAEFAAVKEELDRRTPPQVQAYALTWLKPYRVDCMSITSAIAFGFDREFCSDGCQATRRSPYFNSFAASPFDRYRMRPAMSIAATDLQQARALIDRGVAADGSAPRGTAYLVNSGDHARSVRSFGYAYARIVAGSSLKVEQIDAESISHRKDVMFYFIGARDVPDIASNHFLPGAVADHLTSTGGNLLGTHQMSSLRWLEAGATGSYGTVVEPCNFSGKFPDPAVLLLHYLAGETLIEAYWQSVAMPGQGIFIGEPLARPYGSAGQF